jgi:PAS domain S-box-containing protein
MGCNVSSTRRFAHSLTGKALLRLAVLGAAVLLIFGAVGAHLLYRQIEAQELERLALQAAERARVAEQVLDHVADMHRTVRDEFRRRWPSYQDAAHARRFEALLERDAVGAWRSRSEIADGRQHPTGWVRRGVPPDDDLKRRVVMFHDLSARYGPGAATRNDNLYFVSVPEQSNMGYDPFLSPTWSADVPSDFDQLGADWGRTAYAPATNDATRWSAPEIDDVSPALGPVFAVLTPVRINGRHLATIGTTLVAREFVDRVLPASAGDTRYVALFADGRPLLEPKALPRLDIAAAALGRSEADDALVALARIDGPGWYVAALLPTAVVRAHAATVLAGTLAVGVVALLLPMVIVAAVLKRRVARPLGELTRAAETLAGGDTGVRLPVARDDELGRLATAFNDMTQKVAERDAALREDKRRIEQALTTLRLTDERWRAMTDNAADVVVVVDADDIVRDASPPIRRLLGLAPEAVVGRPAFERVHAEDAPGLRERLVAAGGAPVTFRAQHADGRWRVLEGSGSALYDHPAVRGLVLNVRDVTAAIEAEQELTRQRDALHQSEKLSALGSLLAGVAHELNNPLTVVVGRAMQLEDAAASARDRERAQQIRLAAERCTRIVRTFLAMARRQPSARRETDVNAVVRGALELLGYMLRSGDVQLELNLAPALPQVLADADQLSQVFLNLVTNAQQAMAASPGPRRLTVATRAEGGRVVVEVADNGPGVAPELAGRIFEPFFTTKAVGEGTGVGLAVSLGIVQAHGGSLELAAAPPPGARFVVGLPALASDRQAAQAATPRQALPRARPQRILVVDDEAEIAHFLRDVLEGAGHRVSLAADGREALRRHAQQDFDLVITDLKMPVMDGPALHRELLQRDPRLAARTVVMTGDLLSGRAHAFARDSGLPVLDKPFRRDDALAVVARVVAEPAAAKVGCMFTVAPAAEQPTEPLHAALLAAYSDYVAGAVVLALADWPSFIGRQCIDLASSRVALDASGAVLAFAFVAVRDARQWRLASLGAVPAARGTGAAPALLDELNARALAAGVQRLELEVFAQNPRALRLYESRGFEARHALHGYALDAPAAGDAGGVDVVSREAALQWLDETAAALPDLPLQVTARTLAVRTLPSEAWRAGSAQLVFATVPDATPPLVNVLSLVDREAAQHGAGRLVRALIARHPGWRIQVPPLQRLDVGGQALRDAGFAALPLHQLWMAKPL